MEEQLEVLLADDAQKEEAFRNVFEMWPCGDTLEEHLRWRLQSPQHRRARWYVGVLGDRVVCSLGAYPIVYVVAGQTMAGFAIGAVHTLPEFRGRGLAPGLIQGVESMEQRRGAALAMLFSDIAPAYYGKLGYQIGASHRLRVAAQRAASPLTLTPFSDEDAEHAQQRYGETVANSEFAIARDPDYWGYLTAKSPEDWAFWVDRAPDRLGYVRLRRDAECSRLILSDYAPVLAKEDWKPLVEALRDLAAKQALESVAGWAPQAAATEPRVDEITMLKSLDPALTLTESMLAACDTLREIDHV